MDTYGLTEYLYRASRYYCVLCIFLVASRVFLLSMEYCCYRLVGWLVGGSGSAETNGGNGNALLFLFLFVRGCAEAGRSFRERRKKERGRLGLLLGCYWFWFVGGLLVVMMMGVGDIGDRERR